MTLSTQTTLLCLASILAFPLLPIFLPAYLAYCGVLGVLWRGSKLGRMVRCAFDLSVEQMQGKDDE